MRFASRLLSFRVSGTDAHALVREFAASGEGLRMADDMYDVIVPATELQNLPDYKLFLRTLLNGRPQEPYLVDSFPPFQKSGTETTADTVIKTSLQRYGRDREGVERMLSRFLN
jgi:hypothetical protein